MVPLVDRLFPMLSQLVRTGRSESSPIVLDRRRIYILPTRYGLVFGLILLAMLIGSINYALSLGYVLTFLLGSISTLGILSTYNNLQGIRIAEGGTTAAFAGDNAAFHLDISAPNPRLSLQLRSHNQKPLCFDLNDATHQRITLPVPAKQRGWLKPGRLTLFTVYPLGLFRAWSYVQFDQVAIVYPKPADTSHGFPAANETGNATHRRSAREGTEDFAGLRDYQPGDSPRQVAWKVAARSDELVTKRFSDAEGGSLMLDWDQLAKLDIESRLSQLTRWVLNAEKLNLPYGLRIPGIKIPPGHGIAHRNHCLETLALFGVNEHG